MKRILIMKIIASIIYFVIIFISYLKYGNQVFNNILKLVSIMIILNIIVSIHNYNKEKIKN